MRSRFPLLAATLVAALSLAACGSSGGGSAKTGADGAGSSGQSTGGAGGAAGATGRAATGPPIRVGLANMTTGTTSFPAIPVAAEAAAAYINKTQGGLGGRPIKLVTCDMKNDNQAAQQCGQQFANDKTISFVILSATLNGGPFYSALEAAHKPVLGGLGVVPADYAPPGVYFYYTGSNYYTTEAKYIESLHPKTVAMVFDSEPSTVAGSAIIAKELRSHGVTVRSASIPAGSSDVTASVASAGIKSADTTALLTSGGCPKILSAMRTLNVKSKNIVIGAACATSANIASSPSEYEGFHYFSTFDLGATGSGGGPDVKNFLQGYKEYGPKGEPGVWAEVGWGLVLTAAKIFAGKSAVTPASATAAIKTYAGPVVMGAAKVSCPGPAPYNSTCVQGGAVYTVHNGKIVAS